MNYDYIRLTAEIEDRIHHSVLQIQPVSGGNFVKCHYLVKMDSGKSFLYKEVHFSDTQYRTFLNIQAQHIPQFQRINYIWPIANERYAYLAEWTLGMSMNTLKWETDRYLIERGIRSAAESIRKIHADFQTNNPISWTANDIETMLSHCRWLDIQKQKILTNMLDYLPMLNSRNSTVIHGDLHLGNIILAPSGAHFVDLDNASFGDAYLDLTYAANIHRTKRENPLYYLFLQDYFEQHIPDDFWPVVNCYSVFKTIFIMQAEIENSQDHRYVINAEPLFDLIRNGLNRKPSWYLRMESEFNSSV